MAIVLKTTYSTGLTQACPSDHRFSLSMRTKVADLTQVETESARLYAVLQASVEKLLQNHRSVPQNQNGSGDCPRRSLGRDQNHDTWACSRKQRKLLWRFIANCNLDWTLSNERRKSGSANRFEHSTSRKPGNSFAYCTSRTTTRQFPSRGAVDFIAIECPPHAAMDGATE
jgi:hypothetical protein